MTDHQATSAIDDRLRRAGLAEDLDAAITDREKLLDAIRTDAAAEVTPEQLVNADRAIEDAREKAVQAERRSGTPSSRPTRADGRRATPPRCPTSRPPA